VAVWWKDFDGVFGGEAIVAGKRNKAMRYGVNE
jgi:hypothetical protein